MWHSASLVRLVIALAFNAVVAGICYFLGATLATCWFTFLGLTIFAALAEIGERVEEVWTRLSEVEGLLRAIHGAASFRGDETA